MKTLGILAVFAYGLLAAQVQAQPVDMALCQWHPETHAYMHRPNAGYYKEERLTVPSGYEGVRIEGQFRTLKSHPDWSPGVALIFDVGPSASYILRFRRPKGEVSMQVETELWANGEKIAEHVFSHRQDMKADFRADVLWNVYGDVSLKLYTGKKAFNGPYEVQNHSLGMATNLQVVSSTADVKIKSLRFGRVCTPI